MVESYSDRAISGASLIRSGIQVLLADARASHFDMILSETLERISRDQEDVAGVFKRLRFAGVTIFTLCAGNQPAQLPAPQYSRRRLPSIPDRPQPFPARTTTIPWFKG